MDKNNLGFLEINNFFEFIDEERYSIVSPFLERFFDIIKKDNPN
jgi:hypothetical protein